MATRLVLGCCSLGFTIAEELGERYEDVVVVTADERRVESLRSENVPAVAGDPTDPTVVARAVEGRTVSTVVVASEDPSTNRRAAMLAHETFPEAALVTYTGWDPDEETRTALSAVSDAVVDPGRAVTEEAMLSAGRTGRRARTLQRLLRGFDGPLAVVMHDNPDPDAIASAVALTEIAGAAGCDADPIYGGDIAHQENRALVNLLDYDLLHVEHDDIDIGEYAGVALVDHSRPGVNDSLDETTVVDVVIDHHPPREPVEARFVDLRSDVGATSTLLVDYLRRLRMTPPSAVATGLLYGIRVDTQEFRREVSADDYEAAAALLPHVDMATLEKVESPAMSPDTLDTIGRAVRNREVDGQILTSSVGAIRDRDALAQAADRLLDLEDVTTTLVFGYRDGVIYASARSRGSTLDVGETLRDAFSQIGDAGGHGDMAGAQIPMGLLGSIEREDEDLERVVRDVVTDRFFEALRSRPQWGYGARYGMDATPRFPEID